MKVRQFIVTYKSSEKLNRCLESIFYGLSDKELSGLEVYIINNHRQFFISSEFTSNVVVLDNVLRLDKSTGHLARNWNQALMLGFEDLSNPACDIVITTQNDVILEHNYINYIIEMHQQYDLLQFGTGDAFLSYTPHAVKRIGLWDERFCNIGYQEVDYFIRAHTYLKGKFYNGDYLLPPSERVVTNRKDTGSKRGDTHHIESLQYHKHSEYILYRKWETKDLPSFIMYPYFEKDIETLKEQKYVLLEEKE